MEIDFSAMQLGDERELLAGEWNVNRSVFDAAAEYMRNAATAPQFEFFHGPRVEGRPLRWFIRRIR